MNFKTGHLVNERVLKTMDAATRGLYTPLNEEYSRAASTVLAGKDEGRVSLTSGGKLAKFATAQRKAKRAQQKESRRKNR